MTQERQWVVEYLDPWSERWRGAGYASIQTLEDCVSWIVQMRVGYKAVSFIVREKPLRIRNIVTDEIVPAEVL